MIRIFKSIFMPEQKVASNYDQSMPLWIEQQTNAIRKKISECRHMADTYEVFSILQDFRDSGIKTSQITASYFSLMLELSKKQEEIKRDVVYVRRSAPDYKSLSKLCAENEKSRG
jgi:hypothetical protein